MRYIYVFCVTIAISLLTGHTVYAKIEPALQARIGGGAPLKAGYNKTGTASLISNNNLWMTARHVVEGCKSVYLHSQYASTLTNRRTKNVVKSPYIKAKVVGIDAKSDTAFLTTDSTPSGKTVQALALGHHNRKMQKGDSGFAMGFPQGEHGEMALTYLQRVYTEQIFPSGTIRYEMDLWQVEKENVANNAYQGISGGPTINHQGAIVGINAGGRNPKDRNKGLLYTVPLDSIYSYLKKKRLDRGLPRSPNKYINQLSYKGISRNMRKNQQVVKVLCQG